MNLRLITIDDYEKVYDLWLNTPNMGLNDTDDSREGIHKYLKRNPSTCFIAEEGGDISGVILCGHDGRRGFIYHMAVREDRQRQGIGTALVNAAMSALEKEGITKAALVVKSQNDKGNSFWEKNDFVTRQDLVYRNKAIAELKRLDT